MLREFLGHRKGSLEVEALAWRVAKEFSRGVAEFHVGSKGFILGWMETLVVGSIGWIRNGVRSWVEGFHGYLDSLKKFRDLHASMQELLKDNKSSWEVDCVHAAI